MPSDEILQQDRNICHGSLSHPHPHPQEREEMVSKITFLLENKTSKRKDTEHNVNEAVGRNVSKNNALQMKKEKR
jgi:hypothetical protein